MMMRMLVLLLCVFSLSACGGGGGGSSSSTSTTVSGVAAKGLILGGTVKVYSLKADGTNGAQLGTTTQTSITNGSYSVDIGTYTGNVVVEVTGGNYKDEATGAVVANTVIRAALTNVSGRVSAAVSPLTELAVQLGTPLSTDSINKNNSLVSSMVGIDIIGTLPVDASSSAASSKASVDQITYGLMLATISQMSKDQGKTQDQVIADIKGDLASDGQLNITGTSVLSGLSGFMANPNNGSGVTTTTQTPLTVALDYIRLNPITPPANTSDLNKSKKMITDLRNTLLSIYNYQGVGAVGIVETPFKNFANEVETELKPELTNTVNRIAWVIETISYSYLVPGAAHSHAYKDALDLEIWLSADGKTYNFNIYDYGNPVVKDAGQVVIDDPNTPTSGSLTATFKTASSQTLTMTAAYTATKNATSYSSMKFSGNIKVPNSLEIDFSQSGRMLSATFAPDPTNVSNIYPTSVFLSGLVKTKTTQLSGSIDVPTIIYSTTLNSPVPTTATVTGSFEELSAGIPTGTKFSGTINGNWTNAGSWDANLGTTPTNYPQWNATFNGKIEAPASPTITAYLKVTQSSYDIYSIDVKYQRTNTDNSVVFISGAGVFNSTTQITTADLSNQDNLKLHIIYDRNLSKDSRLSGTIKTSGGEKQADVYNLKGIPSVKYIDNYFETLI